MEYTSAHCRVPNLCRAHSETKTESINGYWAFNYLSPLFLFFLLFVCSPLFLPGVFLFWSSFSLCVLFGSVPCFSSLLAFVCFCPVAPPHRCWFSLLALTSLPPLLIYLSTLVATISSRDQVPGLLIYVPPRPGVPHLPLRHDHSFWLRLSFVVLFAQRQMDGCRCDMSYYASYRPCKSLLVSRMRVGTIV